MPVTDSFVGMTEPLMTAVVDVTARAAMVPTRGGDASVLKPDIRGDIAVPTESRANTA